MIAEMLAMRADIEQLKTAFGNAMKVGAVHEVDASRGYRLRLGGTDQEPYLSPFYPHPETGKTSVPLKVGQVVGVVNPTGDPRQGFLVRGGYSDSHASPNEDMAANVFEDAGVRVTVGGGALTITAGGSSVVISDAGIRMVGARIDLN